jgi:putative hydrolase of the HAD superfamily
MGVPVILWDFDGTLATRPGRWGTCMVEVLDEHVPGHGVTRQQVAGFLRGGFPWHDWEKVHDDLCDPEDWWEPVLALITDAMIGVGVGPDTAASLAPRFRESFVNPARWHVFPDSLEALRMAGSAGWRNVIVSNHVPELPDLVFQLGLADHVHAVVNSADNGYEKPHPQAFRLALQAAGDPTTAWIVGDNPIADIAGAAQVGIPGVLARSPEFDSAFIQRIETSYGHSRFPDWMRYCDKRASTAVEAVQLILSQSS